jgi:hypothetical protein
MKSRKKPVVMRLTTLAAALLLAACHPAATIQPI